MSSITKTSILPDAEDFCIWQYGLGVDFRAISRPITDMIQFSQTAIKELKRLQAKQLPTRPAVRLALQSGGCADWIYVMQFDNQLQTDDVFFECGDVKVIVASDILPKLTGTTIDYAEDLMGGSFRFSNPNASQTCGCGISFSTEARITS